MVSSESMKLLIAAADEMEKEMIQDCLQAFEQYHAAVYKLETIRMIGSGVFTDSNDYRTAVTDADRARTACHNSVITMVGILNRMCESHGIAPFYDGIVSEERPHRRNLANAVFEYVEQLIKERA